VQIADIIAAKNPSQSNKGGVEREEREVYVGVREHFWD
jgi:hypothetical protein